MALERWRPQSGWQCLVFERRHASYWSDKISGCTDSKTLWRHLKSLLSPGTVSADSLSGDGYLSYLNGKIDKICSATEGHPAPLTATRPTAPFTDFASFSVNEVSRLLRSMPSKQCTIDPIPTWLVKELDDVLAPVLTAMVNLSFSTGIFPESQKHATVKPLLKKTLDPTECAYFWPIFNLSFVSKLTEKLAVHRFASHAEKNQLFQTCQSAYRHFHSTETAVTIMYNNIVQAVDSGYVCALVLLDMSAAFDTVDHSILLQILQHRFGIADRALH
jgi:hypothetical protein